MKNIDKVTKYNEKRIENYHDQVSRLVGSAGWDIYMKSTCRSQSALSIIFGFNVEWKLGVILTGEHLNLLIKRYSA